MKMTKNVKEIEYVKINMNCSSIFDYCAYMQKSKYNGFWWYLLPEKFFGNYSKPFQNQYGEWFFWIKPFFCWPVDFLKNQASKPILSKSILGYQLRSDHENSNSFFSFRMIYDLKNYSEENISAKRRNLIRKGIERSYINTIDINNYEIIEHCLNIWNEHSARTGWKRKLNYNYFFSSWNELLQCPGTTILYIKEKETSRIIGWLIVKIIGEMAFIDTIATSTEKGRTNPNDSLIYTAIMNLKDIPKVKCVQYGLSSPIESLENFKESIGFKIIKLPSFLHVNPILKIFLKSFKPNVWERLRGF